MKNSFYERFLTKAQVQVLADRLKWTMMPTKGCAILVEGSGARVIVRKVGCVDRYVLQGYDHYGEDICKAEALMEVN